MMPEEESKSEVQMNFQGPVNTAFGKVEKYIVNQQEQLPVGIPQNLPRTGAKVFVGRDEKLAQLHEQLQRT